MSLYAAAFVLSSINNAVDHNFCSIRDHSWVNSNGMVGAGNSTGAGISSPAGRAAFTWTVAGGFKSPQGNQVGCWFFGRFTRFRFMGILTVFSRFLPAAPGQKDHFLKRKPKRQSQL